MLCMRLYVSNSEIQLTETNCHEFTFTISQFSIIIYNGFMPKTIDRMYVFADENFIINDAELMEIFKLRNLLNTELIAYGPFTLHDTDTFIIQNCPTSDSIKEAQLLIERDEFYMRNSNTYQIQKHDLD